MSEKKVLVEINGAIAHIFFNEPKSLNPLTNELKERLLFELKEIEKDDSIKIIIFSGKGKAFCAGGDLKAMQQPYDPLSIKKSMDLSKKLIEMIRNMDKICIAAVHGYAAGAGLSMALATDLIFAEEGTKFILSFKNVGLVPDLGLHYYLPRVIGEWRAKEWMWTGRTISVKEAIASGFVIRETKKNCVLDSATAFANELLEGPINSYVSSKLLINQSATMRLDEIMRLENDLQTILRGTTEHNRSLTNFINRNKQK